MTSAQCLTRLQREYKSILKEPVPFITAHPSPSSLLEWHFVLQGSKGSEFDNGIYHGKLVFPGQYPYKPPSISLFTPNGRFATNTKLCLSMSDYHPESWNPMWSCGSILTGLLSFMYDTGTPTTGSVSSSKQEKLRLASESLAFNLKNPTFRKLFPERVEEHAKLVAEKEKLQQEESEKEQAKQKQQQGDAHSNGTNGVKQADANQPGGVVAVGGGKGKVPGSSNQPKDGVGADPGLPSGSVLIAIVALLACIYFALTSTSSWVGVTGA